MSTPYTPSTEIERLRVKVERLCDALSISACPYVASGHTGDGTVKACIDAGECGCVNKAALRR